MARALGLDARFVAATNVNDVVPEYLEHGQYLPRPSKATVSNAMDVGNPSNFDRILHLYGGDADRLRGDVWGAALSDDETLEAIAEVDRRLGYVMDPHTAVGYLGLRQVLARRGLDASEDGVRGIVLSTAHPAKFGESVEPAIGRSVPLPDALAVHLDKEVVSEPLPADAQELKRRLLAW